MSKQFIPAKAAGATGEVALNRLGLYFHIPYCLHKCGYCDFNSHPINHGEIDGYLSALLRETEHRAQAAAGRKVTTIFLGGGTPTTLPVAFLQKILEKCRRHFSIGSDAEITLEANPATIHRDELKSLRRAGFNRISIGAQSFIRRELSLLERVHSVKEIQHTVDRARQAGFDNLSLDLMFALPGQTAADWEYSLAQALANKPEHISTYNLTIEPGTTFHKQYSRGELKMPAEDDQLNLYKISIKTLKAAGYRHYEISNFAKPGKECRHNLNYWENGEHLGLGAGASSFFNGARFKNCLSPSRYIREAESRGSAVEFSERLEPEKAMGETMMLGLRMMKGISLKKFEKRFHIPFTKVYASVIPSLLEQKLISMKNNRVSLSRKGLYLADSVILEFMV